MQELLDKVKARPLSPTMKKRFSRYMCLLLVSLIILHKLEELDEEDDFTRELARMVQANGPTKRELCAKALLLENTSIRFKLGKTAGRDTIICLSLALGLNVEEAQHLLGYLGYGLSEHIKRVI